MDNDCIFCKIVEGSISSMKVYESPKILAFLDINPLSEGHVLIIPKTHAEKLHQVPDDELTEVLVCAKQLALKRKVQDYNILQNNGRVAHQVVMHVHFHLIPKNPKTGLVMEWDSLKFSNEQLQKVQASYK